MRAQRRRKKKLVVAFHFQQSNQAAWKCDACREKGLEIQRGCGFLPNAPVPDRPVWVRRGVALYTCPRSYISAGSLSALEMFYTTKQLGLSSWRDLPGKLVDSLVVLDQEFAKSSA